MKQHLTKTIACLTLAVSLNAALAQQVLEPLTTFGPNGDGTLRPGDREYLTIGGLDGDSPPNQRGLDFNPATGHLLLVYKVNASRSPEVHILDGESGLDLGQLNLDSLATGGNDDFPLNVIGVADDGAIYAGNLSSAQFPPEFRLYRWENETAGQQVVFPPIPITTNGGDPSNGNGASIHKRWGDTIAVRGSGINTEVLLASRGTLVAILRPTDSNMTTFYSTPLECPVAPGDLGYAVAFGPGNTFYGKDSGGNLHYIGYDLTSGTASNITTFSRFQFPVAVTALATDNVNNRLAAVRQVAGPDKVQLFDVATRTSAPSFIDSKYFSTSNSSSVAAITFGGNKVYALQGDNGIIAFNIANGTGSLPPSIYAQPADATFQQGTNAVLGVGVEGTQPLTYQWYFGTDPVAGATNALLVIPNVQQSHAGTYNVVVANSFDVVTSSNATLTVSTAPPPGGLVFDPFNYPVGSYLSTNGNWFSTTTNAGTIAAGSLSSADLPEPSGNHFTWASSGSFRIPTTTTTFSGSIYFSYLFQAENLAATATIGQFSGFSETTTSTLFGTKTLIRTNSNGGFHLGVAKGGGTTTSGFATNDLALGTPVLLVGRYTFGPGVNDDTADIWVNPDPATFSATNPPTPSVASIGVGAAGDLPKIEHFFFRGGSGNAGTMRADELRLGLTWAEVTPIRIVSVIPQLSIEKDGTSVTVSWPSSVTGYVLEATDSLSSPNWSTINHETAGDENVATVDAESGNLFLRLKK